MRKYRRTTPTNKTIVFFLLLILALGTIGYSYSLWAKTLYIQGIVSTTTWEEACVRIMKVLNGSFTNPATGEDLTEPTQYIGVAANLPTKFQLIIIVKNCGTVDITDMVTDVIEQQVEPINYTASKGTVELYKNHTTGGEYVQNFLNWTIGTLIPNEQAKLEIWIQTLPNPAGKYEPTSGDEGDSQDIEINRGATITATSELGPLSATTGKITLIIIDDSIQGNNLAIIDAPPLPYSTPWTQDSITGYTP
jgi:hypothetical protein